MYFSTGLLIDMKGIAVTTVALGKAHGILLTNRGHVYSFGLNNKGQCGRDFTSSAAKEGNYKLFPCQNIEA
jgi:RCR-type E3 ubiquitin transferase